MSVKSSNKAFRVLAGIRCNFVAILRLIGWHDFFAKVGHGLFQIYLFGKSS
jgi:hypothetical protein